jgi:hypothetical protein
MSGKFASITADLLARKGGAVPSAIVGKPLIDWAASAPQFTQPVHLTHETPLPSASHHHADRQHRDDAHYLRKIQIGLSDDDHERLRILSARKETSRQQIVRDALAAYFTQKSHEYGDQCRCLAGAGPCLKACTLG